jgi:hypothetical protein
MRAVQDRLHVSEAIAPRCAIRGKKPRPLYGNQSQNRDHRDEVPGTGPLAAKSDGAPSIAECLRSEVASSEDVDRVYTQHNLGVQNGSKT